MKKYRYLFWGIWLGALFATPSLAERIYQWKDSNGVIHFTDDKSRVPPHYRERGARDLRPLSVVAPPQGEKTASDPGAVLWRERCASCHFTGFGEKDDLIGLGSVAINAETGFPAKIEDIVQRFRLAADGVLSDMPRIEIGDEELRQIAQYLLKAQK